MREAEAFHGGGGGLPFVTWGLVLATAAPGRGAIPHDPVHAHALGDIVRPVTLTSEMHDAAPDAMLVAILELTVVGLAHDAAEGEARACALEASLTTPAAIC